MGAVETAQGSVAADAADAEQEVIDKIIAAGEDLSHFRALLRKARRKTEEATSAHVDSAADASPMQADSAAPQVQVCTQESIACDVQ